MFGRNLGEVKRVADVDRISELPDFIQHSILTNLDTKEACRASMLSKRWYVVWSSIPVLDFRSEDFKVRCDPSYFDNVRNFARFIDKTMQRYLTNKYRITKMYLELPYNDENIHRLIDEWIMIAVQNNIQNLTILTNDYMLPEILFRAKSLEVLKCTVCGLPYYDTMELISLEYLTLYLRDTLDASMLQRIVSLCPLVELDITLDIRKQSSHLEISLPWAREVNRRVEGRCSETMQSNLQASPLQKFVYRGGSIVDWSWPWSMNVVALKNLKKLEIRHVRTITDDMVSELAYELVALESLLLMLCNNLKRIKISSISLKKFQLIQCPHLTKVIIDTPNLLEFRCDCKLETSVSSIGALDQCIAQFWPFVPTWARSINISWLVKLKSFLVETNVFKSLVIAMHCSLKIAVEVEEELMNVVPSPPYKLKELKLCQISDENSKEGCILAFLHAVFWCCHPDVLLITTDLSNPAAKSISKVLYQLVESWKHPLKRVEVEGIDSSSLISELSEIEFRFRLSWL